MRTAERVVEYALMVEYALVVGRLVSLEEVTIEQMESFEGEEGGIAVSLVKEMAGMTSSVVEEVVWRRGKGPAGLH